MVYTVTLNPALDYTLFLNSFEKNEISRSQKEEFIFGGKGINVSKILNELEIENVATGFIGGFIGGALEDSLYAQNIKTDFVHLEKGITRVNVKLRETSDKLEKIRETDINASGPVVSDANLNSLLEKLSLVESGGFVVLAGSVPTSMPADTYQCIMHHLSRRTSGINFVVDTTGEQLTNTLKYAPFAIKPNIDELCEIFGREIDSLDDIVFYGKELQKLGARNVIVSRGKKGAVLISERDEVFQAGVVKGKPIDTVGAGDSMLAGFVAGWIRFGNYEKALMLGTACANATTFSHGIAKLAKINEMINKLGKSEFSK